MAKATENKVAEITAAIKEAKKTRTVANREEKKAAKALEKVEATEGATAKDKKAAKTAANAAAKAAKAARNTVDALEESLKAEKATVTAEPGNNPGRNALVHSSPVTAAVCKKAGVPESAEGKATLFVHEYCKANANKKGELTKTRKEIVAELREIGIANNTAQTQVTKWIKGEHPKNYSGK